MRGMTLAALGAIALTGCSDKADPAQVAADIAEVEAINDSQPAPPLDLQRISYTDIEKNNLFGAGCGFAPEGRLAVMFLAQEDKGFLKLAGDIRALEPDKDSAELPLSSYSRYDGKDYVVELALAKGEAEHKDQEMTQWPGSMTIRDAKGRTVYRKTGLIGCGA